MQRDKEKHERPVGVAHESHAAQLGGGRRYVRRAQAAKYIGSSLSFLENAAVSGSGPPMLRLSARLIVYDVEALDEWLEQHRVGSTSETAAMPKSVTSQRLSSK
jgi:hypothetical protein